MDRLLPLKLGVCPLIDALIEFRFEAGVTKSAVFGMIYSIIKEDYKGEVIPLPILQIPEQIRNEDPNFKYKPLYRIENDKFVIQIGCDVLSISSKIPYVGWQEFSMHSLEVVRKIVQAGILKRVSRIGHHYINFFDGDIADQLTMSFSMTEGFKSEDLLISTTVRDEDFISTLRFANNATYRQSQNSSLRRGSLIDIDTSREYNDNYFISNSEQEINTAHESEKKLFFSLLKSDYLDTLNPIFEE